MKSICINLPGVPGKFLFFLSAGFVLGLGLGLELGS